MSIDPESQSEIASVKPLTVDEVITCFRFRWGVSYDLRLLERGNNLYFQIMWGYLEQQSFPKTEESYRLEIKEALEIINRIGQSAFVREWIENVNAKPRIGKVLSLQLRMDERLKEFLL